MDMDDRQKQRFQDAQDDVVIRAMEAAEGDPKFATAILGNAIELLWTSQKGVPDGVIEAVEYFERFAANRRKALTKVSS